MPDIDPFKKKPAEDLLARATGRELQQTPLAAVPIPGITGNPPLPVGKVVGQVAASSLTEIERQTLSAAGWTEGQGLPASQEGQKQLQEAISRMKSVEVPLPVDPRTPPVQMKTVPIESLPAEKRNALIDVINSIKSGEVNKTAAQRQTSEAISREAAIPGIGDTLAATDKAVDAFRTKVQAEESYEVPMPSVRPKAKPAAEKHDHSETGAAATLDKCPHCSWDLSLPDIAEPPHGEKMAFLQCLMGDKPFVKAYPLFDGNVTVTFRTLTTRELDVIYKQAYLDRESGKLPNVLDYWEWVNRYRLLLQLQAFRSEAPGGFQHDLPDGYSKTANPSCSGVWVTGEREAELTANETGLPAIETYVIENVLKTEAVFRIVNNTCSQFNRLAAKMEAMADNQDFWRPIGERS